MRPQALLCLEQSTNCYSETTALLGKQRTAAQKGDGLHLVEYDRSVHETNIALNALIGAINELLLREAMACIL